MSKQPQKQYDRESYALDILINTFLLFCRNETEKAWRKTLDLPPCLRTISARVALATKLYTRLRILSSTQKITKANTPLIKQTPKKIREALKEPNSFRYGKKMDCIILATFPTTVVTSMTVFAAIAISGITDTLSSAAAIGIQLGIGLGIPVLAMLLTAIIPPLMRIRRTRLLKRFNERTAAKRVRRITLTAREERAVSALRECIAYDPALMAENPLAQA